MYHPICGCHHHPPKPPPDEGVLLPKIIARETRTIPRLCTQIEVTGLPAGACPPFRLVRVQAGAAQPSWTILGEADGCGRVPVCISIPLNAFVCDSRGCTHMGVAVVKVETWLPRACCFPTSWRHSLFIQSNVQLCMSECCSEDCCFQVQLYVALDIYLLCFEPHLMRRPAPACPKLPLYPQPVCPPMC